MNSGEKPEPTEWVYSSRMHWISVLEAPGYVGGKVICSEVDADEATLICAAPKLLTACKDVLERLERFKMDYDSRQILKNALRPFISEVKR